MLQALYFMKSLISGGILLAWAVFLELILITTLTCWTCVAYWWLKEGDMKRMCILASIVMGDYVFTVCCTKMDKVRPWQPKDGDNLMGGETGAEVWQLLSCPWYCFLIVKWRVGYYQNNQKVVIWNDGNLELEINLNAASNFSRLRWG